MPEKSHPKNALSATFVSKTRQPGRYADGHGLYPVIEPSGSRRWEQRLAVHGKRRELGLGGYPLVTLAMAREAALANRRAVHTGGDPLAEKRTRRGVPTFGEATAIVFDLRRPGWRSARHAQQWIESLNEYAMPKLGPEDSARQSTRAPKSVPVTGEPVGPTPKGLTALERGWWRSAVRDWPQLSRRDRSALRDYVRLMGVQADMRALLGDPDMDGRLAHAAYRVLDRTDRRLHQMRRDFDAFVRDGRPPDNTPAKARMSELARLRLVT